MLTAIALTVLNITNSSNPINISLIIIITSLLVSVTLFNISLNSWLPLVTVITFSSGIITAFTYVASISPNENTNSSNSILWIAPLLLITWALPQGLTNTTNVSINTFSGQTSLIIFTGILILFILAISNISFSPHQSIVSSF